MTSLSRLAYAALGATGWPALRRRVANAAPVFCFHNVVPDALAGSAGDGALHIGRAKFAALVDWIRHAYTIVPVRELAERLGAGRRVAGLACLTFDDGYRGVFTDALPLLRAHGLPAAVFVVTEAAERERAFWWDVLTRRSGFGEAERARCLEVLRGDASAIAEAFPLAAQPALPEALLPAEWELVIAACRHGFDIGAHTVSHVNLTTVAEDRLRDELTESRRAIAERTGVEPSAIAYPYGVANHRVVEAAARAGYATGLTLGFGTARREHHLLSLPRINIPATIHPAALRCWASGVRLGTPPIKLAPDRLGTAPPVAR